MRGNFPTQYVQGCSFYANCVVRCYTFIMQDELNLNVVGIHCILCHTCTSNSFSQSDISERLVLLVSCSRYTSLKVLLRWIKREGDVIYSRVKFFSVNPAYLVCGTRFCAFRNKFCCFAYQISWVHTLKN